MGLSCISAQCILQSAGKFLISDFGSATIKCPIKGFWDVDRFLRIRQYRAFYEYLFSQAVKLGVHLCTTKDNRTTGHLL